MNIIWISSLAWKSNDGIYTEEIKNPGAIAGSLFQQNIIEGLDEQGVNVDIINEFPGEKNNKKNKIWYRNGKNNNLEIKTMKNSFFNYFNKVLSIVNGFKEINSKQDYDVAIIYLMHLPYIFAAIYIKLFLKKNIKLVLICPDLPKFMDLSLENKRIKKIMKKIENKIINFFLKFIDGYILFSEPMISKLKIESKKTIVVEGVYSNDDVYIENDLKKESIMYSGSLQQNFGIENLIEGFEKLNRETTELWIFGSGVLEDYIIKKAKSNKKIKFFGFVNRETVLKYQRQATLLVNVRNPKDEFTKYSFPSKTFEYMASGTPLLCTRLLGIPAEYFNYMYVIDSNNIETISKALGEIFVEKETDRDYLGQKAREFIIKNKDKNKQAFKINEYLKNTIIGGK